MLGKKLRAKLASSKKIVRLGILAWISMALKRRPELRPSILRELESILSDEGDPDVRDFLQDMHEARISTQKIEMEHSAQFSGLSEAASPYQSRSSCKTALLSYARRDNTFHKNAIVTMGDVTKEAVNIYLGTEDSFDIFCDINSIKPGERWQEKIDEAIGRADLLIPVLSPSFFSSHHCLYEVREFMKRQKERQRNDLIIPVLYVDLEKANINNSFLKKDLLKRQYFDWRGFRFEDIESNTVTQAIDNLAIHIIDTVWPKLPA